MKLVRSIRIADGAPLVQELSTAIERELRNTALPNQRTKFRHQLEGWWMGLAIRSFSIEGEKTVTRNELEMMLQEIRDGYKKDNLPLYYEIQKRYRNNIGFKPKLEPISGSWACFISQKNLRKLR